MASTNKTNKGFNKWAGEDKPTRSDFNSDNEKVTALLEELDGKLQSIDNKQQLIDTKLAELDSQLLNKANKAQPAKMQLPFSSGYSNLNGIASESYYTKTEDGFVLVHFRVKGSFTHGGTFAVLPAGYRPGVVTSSQSPHILGICSIENDAGTTRIPASVLYSGSGNLRLINMGVSINGLTCLRGSLYFLAEA